MNYHRSSFKTPLFLVLLAVGTSAHAEWHSGQKCKAEYVGSLIIEALPDGQRVRLRQPYSYNDESCRTWNVPENAEVDGASIPPALYSVVGGPLDGRYRNASVVHDWYCDIRNRPWQQVHRMFYEAMLTSGVSIVRAKLMYLAVLYAGPRWDDMTVANAKMAFGISSQQDAAPPPQLNEVIAQLRATATLQLTQTEVAPPKKPFSPDSKTLQLMADIVESNSMSPEQIELLASSVRPNEKPKPKIVVELSPPANVAYEKLLKNYESALLEWRTSTQRYNDGVRPASGALPGNEQPPK